nr:ATP-binding protein [Methylobacterium sp. OTU13CASTA1]
MIPSIQDCLIKIEKRAERAGDEKLLETFVDAAPLYASVETTDHQVIFGRRGTGKTHVLKILQDNTKRDGDLSVYLDLRSIGSNSSIYNDREKSHPQRATPLLLDVLGAMHDALLEASIDNPNIDLSQVGPCLDELADSISTVEVVGTTETSREDVVATEKASGLSAMLGVGKEGPTAQISGSTSDKDSLSGKTSSKQTGSSRYYVRFGSVQSAINRLLEKMSDIRIWLLLDEWSEIPIDLQPYLADLLRRCVLPSPRITVKIAAIEHRSNFSIRGNGEYTGIELGADAGADVNLDDFMVFDNDADRSKSFFSSLLYKHYRAADGLPEGEGAKSPDALISQAFTQITAFEELVRAVEGVPRDAVYLAAHVARKAYGRLISVNDVRAAAREWYQRDKASLLRSNSDMADLLDWVVKEVIAHRKARAFLLPSHQRNAVIDSLFDARLLHILKKSISSHDNPGIRYDVYKLDYGCYVDLITTSRSPAGLLPSDDDDQYVDVPPDDYRSIRRAILDLSAFEARSKSLHERAFEALTPASKDVTD